ncbi:hypothetical protein ACFWIB_37395 [Streptomyces sp. NPDC127051]|uniref:hypothetical protein n=1 Tax=Streptomyces sp. NPDC127051 TaxID=3347119 RepID=UPI0036670B21
MSNTPQHEDDRTLAYPEPPAHPMWHPLGPKPQPLSPDQQQRNTERLLRALHAPRTRSPRSTETLHTGPRPDALPGQRQKALPTA